MAQQNIDFGAFPDDPSADAIRTAFQKVQTNFDQLFEGIETSGVDSINRSAGSGITVNQSTGNVVVSANISNVQVYSPNLLVGTSLSVLGSSTVYDSSNKILNIVVPNTFTIGNLVASNATFSANITALNANLGNAVIANYFIGAGNNLSNIQGSNVTGAVSSATTAGTVTTAAQPNITSVGTLTSASISGNANIGNIGTAGLITATGNLTAGNIITGGVVSATGNGTFGNVSATTFTGALSGAATTAGTVTTADQPNITSTGTLASLSVSGNANIGNIGSAGIVSATGNGTFGNVSATLFTGNVSGTGNSNVGNLGATGIYATTLSATGNANVGNLGATGVIATTLDGSLTTASQPNVTSLGTLSSLSVSGNAVAGNISTAGNIIGGNLSTGGTLSVVGTTTLGNLSVTGTLNAGNITVDQISNGTTVVDIVGSGGNVTTTVAGTANVLVVTATGVDVTGTFSASGNANVGNIGTAGLITATGNITGGNINTAGAVVASTLTSNVSTGTAPLTVTSTTQVANLNVATAGKAGTVTTAAQPNITSVGNLTNLTSNGTVNFSNATDVSLGSNTIVHITGGTAGQVLATDGSGNLDWVTYSGSPIAGSNTEIQFKDSDGNLGASANLTFNKTTNTLSVTNILATTANITGNIDANIIIASGNINGGNLGTGGNITASGNITGAYILGNGSQLSGLPSGTGIANGTSSVTVPTSNGNVVIVSAGNTIANITGTGINVAGTLSVSGYANIGNIGATNGVFTNVSGNGSALTSIAGANVTGEVSFAATANTVAGANVSGAVSYATTANAVAGANVSGQVSFAATANAVALANVSGAGNLASVNKDGNASNILYGNGVFASAPVTYNDSNVATFLASFGSNTITTTGNVSVGNIIGNGQALTGIAGANVTGQVGNATVAGTVYSNAQPNITSVGTLTSVIVSGNINGGNIGTGGLITASGNITGGNLVTAGVVSATGNVTGNYFIGNGSQLTGIDATSIQNGNSNVKIYANANVAISSAGNSNIILVTGTGAIVNGTLSATGNVSFTGANVSLGAVGNLKITGGTANYFLQTDGAGNLTWATSSSTVAGAYVFTQASAATTWVINHNLGYQYVNIEVIDSTGNSFTGRYNYPTITFNNTTHCTVVFDSAQAGYAAVSSGGGAQGPTGPAASIGGSNTQVQFNDGGVFGGSAAFTFNKSSNLVSMTSLSITANANIGNIGTAGVITATGNITGGNISGTLLTGTLSTASQPNVTAVGTLASLSVTGNITGANINATTYSVTGVTTGISAAGSAQGDATGLTKDINIVSTVTAGQGVRLPSSVAGMILFVTNDSATTLNVYPASGASINAAAANVAYSLPTKATVQFVAASTTRWLTVTGTYA